jgi:diacylglycerol kinase family enzyme
VESAEFAGEAYRSRLGPVKVVLNAASGSTQAPAVEERIRERCGAEGREVVITTSREVHELHAAVEAALGVEGGTLIVGGGDGTISSAAALLAGREIALGVLPLGTLNHCAKDVGIPLELDEALTVALGDTAERFDVGELNGRIFLNNSSLGLYPLIVRLRAQHPVRGMAKWAVAAWAALREIRRPREMIVRIEVEGAMTVHRTPIVMVSNNVYRAEGLDAASRDSLRQGLLAIYVVKRGARRHLRRLAWRVFRGRARADELEVLLAKATTIEAPAGQLEVALDGEVELFQPPLEYRIRPGALLVRVPRVSSP